MYHAGWAWAGSTPFHHTKLVASHFGGTRNPMAISWPRRITPDGAMRNQFHHVNDIVPTIYEILGIPHPDVVDGHSRSRMDGISLVYTFDHADEPTRKDVQYFENSASRGIYSDGWFACAFGPFVPWDTAEDGRSGWPPGTPSTEPWELYHLDEDFSQANDLAAVHPDEVGRLKASVQGGVPGQPGVADRCRAVAAHPSRGPRRLPVHQMAIRQRPAPGCRSSPHRAWGDRTATSTIALTVPDIACGVLYALGGFSGGLTLFMDAGFLVYEYNMLIIDRFQARSAAPIGPGPHVITVDTTFDSPRRWRRQR